jgi:mono/diheme cytochrome c family protein
MNNCFRIWAGAALAAASVGYVGAQAPRPAMPRAGVGPADRQAVDPAAADRGRHVWATECITCHGAQARGTENGSNLIRSSLVLHDRFGNLLGPFLKKGHPMQSGTPGSSLTDTQVVDLTHFLRQRIDDSLRGSAVFTEQDVLTGDPKAGAAYFNGEGKCATCHSAAANSLDGIASRLSGPVDVQQRMLFPGGRGGRSGRAGPAAVTVTMTPASGPPISGTLVEMDDLFVTYRDASGAIRVIRRVPMLKIVKTDPLQAHHELLDRITDKNIHDLVAYLETMK